MSNHDYAHYAPWRKARINKLEQIFGKEYFRGRSVLECGAGKGLIGKYLREEWGANVTFTEGREELVEEIKRNNPGAKVWHINHEEPWVVGRFDFVIHWGLLYHLNAWKSDLIYTINSVSKPGVLTLESEVLDYEGDVEIKGGEPKDQDDQSMVGIGTQMTAAAVENQLSAFNVSYRRYDDADLNADFHHYNWKPMNNGKRGNGQRRFWICYT